VLDINLYELNNGKLVAISSSQQRAENWVKTDNRLSFSIFGVDYKSLENGGLVSFQDINYNAIKTKITNDLAETNIVVEEIEVIEEGRELTFKIKVLN
jgi:hypothetical protein